MVGCEMMRGWDGGFDDMGAQAPSWEKKVRRQAKLLCVSNAEHWAIGWSCHSDGRMCRGGAATSAARRVGGGKGESDRVRVTGRAVGTCAHAGEGPRQRVRDCVISGTCRMKWCTTKVPLRVSMVYPPEYKLVRFNY